MAKVVQLTESQFNQLVLEEKQAAVLCEAFAGMNFNQALENAKKYIKNGVKIGAIVAALAATYNLNDADKLKSNLINEGFGTFAERINKNDIKAANAALQEFRKSYAGLNQINEKISSKDSVEGFLNDERDRVNRILDEEYQKILEKKNLLISFNKFFIFIIFFNYFFIKCFIKC